MKTKRRSIFDDLDMTIKALKKAVDEEEDIYGPDEEPEEDQPEEPMMDEEGEEEEEEEPMYDDQMGKSYALAFPKTARERDALVKSLSSLSYSNQSKKSPVQGKHETHQDNFVEEGIQDESWEGQKTYDDYDQGYGGPSPMPPKLMHPKEYEALYNSIVADGRKGPSINTTTVSNEQAYESKKSFGGDELVDVTPFMKSFDDRLDGLAGTVKGLAQMVGKIGEGQAATTRALATVLSKSQGRKSVPAMQKSQQPQVSRQSVLPLLEKGVAEGKLSPIELTKFETTGAITPAIQGFISMEGGLR